MSQYFTSQREEFEGTRENMLVWLTELDLQLTNVEHFSDSAVHHKIQQLNVSSYYNSTSADLTLTLYYIIIFIPIFRNAATLLVYTTASLLI